MFRRNTGRDHRNIYRYHPDSKTLTDLGNILPTATNELFVIDASNGYIYVLGGRGQLGSMIVFDPQMETIIEHNSNLFSFNDFIQTAWKHKGIIYIIEANTGKIYELNTSNNELALSTFQIFNTELNYNPMVSKDDSTGIIYLISGTDGTANNTVKTVRKLVPNNY